MPNIDLTIVKTGDKPVWQDVDQDRLIHTQQDWQVAAIEAGTASGAPSVALRLDLANNRSVVAETTLAAWIAATASFRGAFPAAFANGPLSGTARGPSKVGRLVERLEMVLQSTSVDPNKLEWLVYELVDAYYAENP